MVKEKNMSNIPDRQPLKDITPFRYWCQKILPLTYDDSMSYYELLCKVVEHLNNATDDILILNDDVTNLYSFVDNYFTNLDVQEEINAKLDAMALDGSLSAIINPLLPSIVSEWLSTHISPTSPAVDDTLKVKGAAADAEQTGFVGRGALTDKFGINYPFNLVNTENLLDGSYSLTDGSIVVVPTWYYSEQYYPAGTVTSNARPFIISYDENYNFLRGIQATANTPYTPNSDTAFLRFCVNSLNTVISYGTTALTEEYCVELQKMSFNQLMADAINSVYENLGFKYSGNTILTGYEHLVAGEYYDINSGVAKTSSDFVRNKEFYPVTGDDVVSTGRPIYIFYDEKYNYISGYQPEGPNEAVTIPENAKYMRYCFSGIVPVISFNSVTNIAPREYTQEDLKTRIEDKFYTIYNQVVPKQAGNIYHESLLQDGYYHLSTGELVSAETWKHDPTFYRLNGEKLTLRNAFFIAYYDGDFDFISSVSGSANSTITPPANAHYFRYSLSFNPNYVYGIYYGTSLGAERNIIKIENLSTEPDYIIVDVNGGGDYTSLTEALYDTRFNIKDIYVKGGTYNIVNEYKALFGNDIFSSLADNYPLDGFQMGLRVDEREIKFAPDSRVLCYLNGVMTVDGTHRFSVFNLYSNATLTGLQCAANNVFYMIHDDFGYVDKYYTNIIQDCILTMVNPVNRNIIGGGVKLHSTNIVRRNYMNNGLASDSETVRYHNYNNANANAKVEIYDNKVNGFIGARYYGEYTTNILNFIAFNNVTGSGVIKLAETPDSENNVSLFAWNNTIES